jgi:hypothetical protein
MDTLLLSVHHTGHRRRLKDWLAAHYTVLEADSLRGTSEVWGQGI